MSSPGADSCEEQQASSSAGRLWARRSSKTLARRIRRERARKAEGELLDDVVDEVLKLLAAPSDVKAELQARLYQLGRALLLHWACAEKVGHQHNLGQCLRLLDKMAPVDAKERKEYQEVKALGDRARHEPRQGSTAQRPVGSTSEPQELNAQAPPFVPGDAKAKESWEANFAALHFKLDGLANALGATQGGICVVQHMLQQLDIRMPARVDQGWVPAKPSAERLLGALAVDAKDEPGAKRASGNTAAAQFARRPTILGVPVRAQEVAPVTTASEHDGGHNQGESSAGTVRQRVKSIEEKQSDAKGKPLEAQSGLTSEAFAELLSSKLGRKIKLGAPMGQAAPCGSPTSHDEQPRSHRGHVESFPLDGFSGKIDRVSDELSALGLGIDKVMGLATEGFEDLSKAIDEKLLRLTTQQVLLLQAVGKLEALDLEGKLGGLQRQLAKAASLKDWKELWDHFKTWSMEDLTQAVREGIEECVGSLVDDTKVRSMEDLSQAVRDGFKECVGSQVDEKLDDLYNRLVALHALAKGQGKGKAKRREAEAKGKGMDREAG